jgi:hypothetical protein
MKNLSFMVLTLLVSDSVLAQAAKKTAADPAKTACIKLLNGSQKDVAAVEAELKKSSHFKLAESCARSDMSIWISVGSPAVENLCRATVQALGPDQKILWSETRHCKSGSQASVALLTRRLLADLGTKKRTKSGQP